MIVAAVLAAFRGGVIEIPCWTLICRGLLVWVDTRTHVGVRMFVDVVIL